MNSKLKQPGAVQKLLRDAGGIRSNHANKKSRFICGLDTIKYHLYFSYSKTI